MKIVPLSFGYLCFSTLQSAIFPRRLKVHLLHLSLILLSSLMYMPILPTAVSFPFCPKHSPQTMEYPERTISMYIFGCNTQTSSDRPSVDLLSGIVAGGSVAGSLDGGATTCSCGRWLPRLCSPSLHCLRGSVFYSWHCSGIARKAKCSRKHSAHVPPMHEWLLLRYENSDDFWSCQRILNIFEFFNISILRGFTNIKRFNYTNADNCLTNIIHGTEVFSI